jgi:hypothetical protein
MQHIIWQSLAYLKIFIYANDNAYIMIHACIMHLFLIQKSDALEQIPAIPKQVITK